MKSSSIAATKKEKVIFFVRFFRHASLLNRSNSNRIDAKETSVVVAETKKEETVAGTSLRFSTDVVGSSSSSTQQQPHLLIDQKVKMNTYTSIVETLFIFQHASRLNSSAVNNHNRSIAV